jgi:uncharacterized glyoxalase superfamily protein PhnB
MNISPPTPELPVPDVKAAQAYYRDHFGFEIAWYNEGGDIGAVSHGDCAIFLRKTETPISGGTFWVFCEDVDAAHSELVALGADITEPIANTAWGMRQFTVQDAYGNTFYFHHDL